MKNHVLAFVLFVSSTGFLLAAPTLTRTVPALGSTGISTTTKIVLQFSEEVVAGSGDCLLNGQVLLPTIASKYVTFTPSPMEYLTNYSFTVPAGAFKNKSGESFSGISLTFVTQPRPQPAARLFDAVVAKDGSGNFTSIQKAIDAMPENRTQPWLVFVKTGVYEELVQIKNTKTNLHLIGQDKEKTVIQYKVNAAGSNGSALEWQYSANRLGLPSACVVLVEANDFMAENISFINTWGTEILNGPMALAIHARADRAVYNNCILRSYQDTWQTNGRHYVKNCFIEGAVDFIYGGGDCFFDSCTINIARDGSVIVAPAHSSEKWGYVFMNCNVTAAKAWSTSLGRPWINSPKASYVNTRLSKNVSVYPTGWTQMGTIPAVFADYNTMNYLGQPVDLSQRINHYYYTDRNTGLKVEGDAKNKLTAEEVASFTIRNVLSSTDAWKPDDQTRQIATPIPLSFGDQLRWKNSPYAICYVVSRNDTVVEFTKDSTYTLTQPGTYKIQAVNEYGGLSGFSAPFVKTTSGIEVPAKPNAKMRLSSHLLRVEQIHGDARLEVVSLNGMMLASETIRGDVERPLDLQVPCLIRLRTKEGVETLKYVPLP